VSACLRVILLHITYTSHYMCWICVLQTSNSLENGEYRIMVSFISVCLCDILRYMWDQRFWYYFLLNQNENNSGSMWVIFRREELNAVNSGNTKVTVVLDAMPYCLEHVNRLLRGNFCIRYQGNYISLLTYSTAKVADIAETSVYIKLHCSISQKTSHSIDHRWQL
jgi:hypothetical protein